MSRYKNYNADFQTSELGFPSVFLPEDEKGDKYHKEWAKAMYSFWHNGKAAIPQNTQKDIDMLRAYGRGEQPIEIYLKNKATRSATSAASDIDGNNSMSKEWLRDGRNNLDLNIISVAPKVKSMIKAYLANIREDVVVDTIDPLSGAEKDHEKYKLYLYSQHKEFIDSFMKAAGLEPDEPEFLPDGINELEMYDTAGGFKLTEASNIEKLIQYSHELSGYDHDLEADLYDDLMDIGIAATKKYLDPEDLKFKDKYVDPKYLIVQHSTHNDFRDIDWVGHVEFYTIAQLRKWMPDLDEDDLRQMAYAYKGRLGNPSDFRKHNMVADSGSHGYDNWSVAVFECEWIDQESESAVFYDNARGKTSRLPVTEETTKGLGDRKRFIQSNLQKLREAHWVVGTEYCFNYGSVNMQDRPSNNKVISNYHIRAIGDIPLMAQMRPLLDDLEISYLRWQDARANAVKDGYALNLSKLKTIGQGDDKLDVWSVLKLWKERGLLLYQDSLDGEYKGGKTLPIDRLPNTLLDEIQEFMTAWDHALKRLEDITGINALILGAAPDPDAPVTTQKLSVASSANAIKPLGIAMSDIRRKSAWSFLRRFILAAKTRKDIIESYEGVIGRQAIENLLSSSKSMRDYGMVFNLRPTDAEKMEIMKAVEQSMQNRREGRPGIDLQTAMYVREQLYAGTNLKWLRFYIGAMEKRIAKQDMERQERMINLQADRNDRSAQIAAQGNMQEKQMSHQSDAQLQAQKGQSDLMNTLVGKNDRVAEQVAQRLGLAGSQSPEESGQNQGV